MRVVLPFFPILGMLFCLCTAMQSMGYKAAPVASSCIELLIKTPGAALLIPTYGYLGTCMTEPRTWTIMALFLVGHMPAVLEDISLLLPTNSLGGIEMKSTSL